MRISDWRSDVCSSVLAMTARRMSLSAMTARGVTSHVGVGLELRRAAGVGDGALVRRADGLGVFPDRAGAQVRCARLPGLAPFRHLGIGHGDIARALHGADGDYISIL